MAPMVQLPDYWPLYIAPFWALWSVGSIIYRRYFHPLSNIPGPFMWAVTRYPILYHQHFREGNLMHAIAELHEKYGPVIRIAPNEVHLSDPANHEKIYTIGPKYLKDPGFYGPIDVAIQPPIILAVTDYHAHKVRRAGLNAFFSRRSVLELEDIIWSKARKLCDMMQRSFDTTPFGTPFDLNRAVRAATVDTVTEYAYGRSWDNLDLEDFGSSYQGAIRAVQGIFVWLHTFPVITTVLRHLPEWLRGIAFDGLKRWDHSTIAIRDAVTAVRKEISMGIKPDRRTIFHALMDPEIEVKPGGKPREPLSDDIVFAEAIMVTGAGTETTGSTSERAIFEVLDNPAIHKALTKELRGAFPDPNGMRVTALEQLPILAGVVKEAMRLNPGVPGHLPRIVPPGGAEFNGVFLPQGTVVSMSAWMMHHNRTLFPSPEKFDPMRWTAGSSPDSDETAVRAREHALVPFSRGSRNCIGQTLAMCEMYCTVAAIFHRFGPGTMAADPAFGREDLRSIELIIGYHPKNARRFMVVQGQGASDAA